MLSGGNSKSAFEDSVEGSRGEGEMGEYSRYFKYAAQTSRTYQSFLERITFDC